MPTAWWAQCGLTLVGDLSILAEYSIMQDTERHALEEELYCHKFRTWTRDTSRCWDITHLGGGMKWYYICLTTSERLRMRMKLERRVGAVHDVATALRLG